MKTKEKWFEKQNRKEDEACGKENENKGEQKDGENNVEKIKEEFWNQFLKQSKKEKRILWKKSHGF